jgi:hypothetical protein
MKKYPYELEISAQSETEADSKMKTLMAFAKLSNAKMEALNTLAAKLSDKELLKLADIVKNDPIKLAMAKNALGV